jgi:ABC-2 type transport system permease protein
MSWAVVARKDFRDAVRSKSLWGVSLLFVLVMVGLSYLFAGGDSVGDGRTSIFLFFVQNAVSLVVPLAALQVGYNSVVGERESGSIKLLLSLPHSRRDVVVGKVLGRSAVVAVATVLAFLVAAVVLLIASSWLALGPYLVFAALTLVFGLAFTALSVGVSASTDSSTKASAGAFGLYVLFAFNLWNWLPNVINYFLNDALFFRQTPEWARLLELVSPNVAYGRVLSGFVAVGEGGGRAAGTDPIYLSEWAALGVLALWIVGSVAVGYWRFSRADL